MRKSPPFMVPSHNTSRLLGDTHALIGFTGLTIAVVALIAWAVNAWTPPANNLPVQKRSDGAAAPIERPHETSVNKSAQSTPAPIGPVETVTRPAPAPSVMANPPTAASSGPKETGPHGQSDVTKPMPKSAPEADRTAPDRPIENPSPKNG